MRRPDSHGRRGELADGSASGDWPPAPVRHAAMKWPKQERPANLPHYRITIELSRVAKQRRLERFVGRQRYDSPEDSTSTRAPCPPKLQDPGAPAMSPPQELAEAPRRTAHGGTPTQPARRRPRHPPQARKGKSVSEAIRPRTTNGLPQETKMLHGRQPGSPRHQSADPCAVKRPTLELSRAAKRHRLE